MPIIDVELVAGQPAVNLNVNVVATSANTYTTLVFNSSGSQTGNRYNTWADLVAAVAAAPEGRKVVQFEQNETIPDGAYNLDYCTLRAFNVDAWLGGVTVTCPAGVTFTSWQSPIVEGALLLLNQDTPLLTVTESTAVVVNEGAILATEDAPMFDVTASPVTMSVTLDVEGRLFNGQEALLDSGNPPGGPTYGNYEIIRDSTGDTYNIVAVVLASNRPIITAGPIVRSTGAIVSVLVNYEVSSPRISMTNPNLGAGSYEVTQNYASATAMAYTPAVTGNWTGADPTTVAAALDRIAAAIGPIA